MARAVLPTAFVRTVNWSERSRNYLCDKHWSYNCTVLTLEQKEPQPVVR